MGDEVMDEVDGWAGRAERIGVAGEQVALVDVAPDRPGGAPPLLVVHGFPTSSIDFSPVVGRLAAERRVVSVDLPGYGLSDKPDRAYSLFGQADVVDAVARDRGLAEVDLLTHDMGDSVGGELLARTIAGESPLRVRRRVLTNGSIYLDMAHLTDGQRFLRSLPDEMLPEGAGPDAEALAATLAALCAPTPPAAGAARNSRDEAAAAGAWATGEPTIGRRHDDEGDPAVPSPQPEPATYEIAGQTVTMPCVVRDASAGTAMFDVDAGVARALVPEAFDLVETAPGRCQCFWGWGDECSRGFGRSSSLCAAASLPRGQPAGLPAVCPYELTSNDQPSLAGLTCNCGQEHCNNLKLLNCHCETAHAMKTYVKELLAKGMKADPKTIGRIRAK